MKYEKVLSLLFLGIILLFIVGCANTTTEVNRDINNYNSKTDRYNDNEKLKYINVNELQIDINNALQSSYGQFSLSSDNDILIPQAVHTMSFVPVVEFDDENSSLNLFFDNNYIQNQDFSEMQLGYEKCISFDNMQDKKYACVSNFGFISMIDTFAYVYTDRKTATART